MNILILKWKFEQLFVFMTCKMVRYDFSSKEECQKFVKEVSEEGWDPVETEGEKVLKMLKGKKSKHHKPSSVEELIAMLSM